MTSKSLEKHGSYTSNSLLFPLYFSIVYLIVKNHFLTFILHILSHCSWVTFLSFGSMFIYMCMHACIKYFQNVLLHINITTMSLCCLKISSFCSTFAIPFLSNCYIHNNFLYETSFEIYFKSLFETSLNK